MRGGHRENAGRKKGPAKVTLKVRVSPETAQTIRRTAFGAGQSLGEAIDNLVRSFPIQSDSLHKNN